MNEVVGTPEEMFVLGSFGVGRKATIVDVFEQMVGGFDLSGIHTTVAKLFSNLLPGQCGNIERKLVGEIAHQCCRQSIVEGSPVTSLLTFGRLQAAVGPR